MRRFHFALSALIVLVGGLLILWLSQLETVTPTQAAESHEESGSEHSEEKKGPHGGVLLGQEQAVQLEVKPNVRADGKMAFTFYAFQKGQSVPLSPENLEVSWQRLVQNNPLSLEAFQNGVRSTTGIDEPHSFVLVLRLSVDDTAYRYQWKNREYRVRLSPEQQRANGLVFEQIKPKVLREEVVLPGKIAVDQDREAHVSPRVAGVVEAVYKHLGDRVRKGELLARINSGELGSLKKRFQLEQTRYTQAKARYELEQKFQQQTQTLLDAMTKGQSLETIHQRLLKTPVGKDREQLITAYTALNLAEKNYERESGLRTENATTEVDFEQAQKAFFDHRARYRGLIEEINRQRGLAVLDKKFAMEQLAPALNMARKQLEVLGVQPGDSSTYYALRSPINGIMISKHIAPGESVMAQEKAFSLADLSAVWAEMMIPEAQLEKVAVGAPVTVASQNGTYQQPGYVTHIGSVVDEHSRTLEAHAEISNASGVWKPGMFVTLRLESRAIPVKMAVRASAIQYLEGQPFVFVRAKDDELQGFPVEMGRETREWVEIKAGLRPGQRYVAKNAYIIKAELEKSSASHDH